MVKAEEVEQLMKKVFPTCPICGADKGYDVSGWFKMYVQCRECGAKWENTDFPALKLEKLQLWEPARDGKGSSLKNVTRPISYWQSLSEEELKKSKQELETELKNARAREKKIEEWKKIEEEVAKGKIAYPYPKNICSDCKKIIQTDGNLAKLAEITSCPRCDSGNLKIMKSKYDEFYESHTWFRVICWVIFFPITLPLLVIYYAGKYLGLIIIIGIIILIIFFLAFAIIDWILKNLHIGIGVVILAVAIIGIVAFLATRKED